MSETVQPIQVQKIGRELAIAWSDGRETYLDLERLRRACPCAVCAGEPDAMGNVIRHTLTYQPGSFELLNWQSIGGYAIQPRWGDGHSTGLYSYAYLRRLGT